MNLIAAYQQLKTQFLTKLASNDLYLKALSPICLLSLLAGAIWTMGPYIAWNEHVFLAEAHKRIYLILLIFLIWLLKFLLIDLNVSPLFYPSSSKKIMALQKNFMQMLKSLKTTTITQQHQSYHLDALPWYLLIGPPHAGKTTLLSNATIPYVLKPKTSQREMMQWWVSPRFNMIDISESYIHTELTQEKKSHCLLWSYLLNLIKKYRGKNGLDGIVIVLPLPDILKQDNLPHYQHVRDELFQRLKEIPPIFSSTLPCQLLITKCDLLPGFLNFFSELSPEEMSQAWGVMLSDVTEKKSEEFERQFNKLIKKLNEQLLWRLHHERNPMARPYIKNFPLQMERIKELTLDFIKSLSAAGLNLNLRGVYLTSAHQETMKEEDVALMHQPINTSTHAVQIFKEPPAASRTYFIKQMLMQALPSMQTESSFHLSIHKWKQRVPYGIAIAAIACFFILLAQDFKTGSQHIHRLQNQFDNYQTAVQNIQNPHVRLQKTIALFNFLQPTEERPTVTWDLRHPFSFYSKKSQQQSTYFYKQALLSVFIPEIKQYLETYLTTPVNKNLEDVYAALKAYLMLGDAAHFQTDFIENTIYTILPESMPELNSAQFHHHLHTALNAMLEPAPLHTTLIMQTRAYLTALPSLKLSYAILRNRNNNREYQLNVGKNSEYEGVFTSPPPYHQVPAMFTAQAFPSILTDETFMAAQEALTGNWVLGNAMKPNINPDLADTLADQLRTFYVSRYIEHWENILNHIQVTPTNQLTEIDTFITILLSEHSPLLKILQTFYDNTYFEPIISYSPKLQHVGELIDKNNASKQLLLPLFRQLQLLHHDLQSILTAQDRSKAAFKLVINRMKNHHAPDVITQLRLIAQQYPQPINRWLNKLADDAWQNVMQEASRHMDISLHDPHIHTKGNSI